MDFIMSIEKKITAILETFIKYAFMLIAILIFVVALMRFTIGASILWAPEVALILFIYCSSIGSALMIVHKQHIRISYFAEKLPKVLHRPLEVVVHILVGFLNCSFIYLSNHWIRTTGYFPSTYTGLPLSVSQTAVPIGCAFVVIYCLYTVLLICFRPEIYYAGVGEETSTS